MQEEYPVEDMDNIPGQNGFVDYVLFGKDGLPLAVIEAKRTGKDPNTGRKQAVLYADALERKFGRRPMIFTTNGFETFFWDDTISPQRKVSGVFSKDDLQKLMNRRSEHAALTKVSISDAITDRYYQKEAIRAVCGQLEQGFRRHLLVMATGTDTVYPARHREIARRIASTPGCALITDYPPGTPPLQINFLRRNRIIAGLSRATILIESRSKGGGMLTARLAFSYSRDVYALPGRIDDVRSQGCNILIKEKTAETILSEKWLVRSIGLKYRETARKDDPEETLRSVYGDRYGKDRIGTLAEIVLKIRSQRGITVEELASATGLAYKEVLEYTVLLETDGIISTDLLQRCYIRLK